MALGAGLINAGASAPGSLEILGSTAESQILTRLLTCLNASTLRPSALKRRREDYSDWHTIAKRAKLANAAATSSLSSDTVEEEPSAENEDDEVDGFTQHFAAETPLLSDATLEAVKSQHWIKSTGSSVLESHTGFSLADVPVYKAKPVAKLLSKLKGQSNGKLSGTQASFLDQLSTYRDVLHSHTQLSPEHEQLRAVTALHVISHIVKGQRKVLANNDALAKAKADKVEVDASLEIRDQGFTRPKVLILLPFRNSAMSWVAHLAGVSPSVQVENQARFKTEFSLPEEAVDKLAEPDAATRYPADHIATFRGNIDDAFRVGLKATRKSLRIFSEFYGSDVIVASPLGLRKSIDASSDADFLSSIEVVVVDQLDAMLMQNWDHIKFLFERLNKLPASPRDTDYSRVKPWYLDGRAAHLRQTILFSAFETPEIRSLFARTLVNVAGRVQLSEQHGGVLPLVHAGVKQTFTRFEAADPINEDDARFETFTTKTLPLLLKSAVMSSHTLIFVPSYFDFVRLREHMKGLTDFSFAAISEYSAGSDVARARTYFQQGKKAFLVVTERFHFFRRYRIRGAKTVIFYGLPDHANFYSELVNSPFMDPHATADDGDISVQAIFSRFDAMRLARIVGDEDAKKMCNETGAARFSFS